MKIEYSHKEKIDLPFWNRNLLWFEISTRGKEEDKLMDLFVEEMKLNMKNQFEYGFNSIREEPTQNITIVKKGGKN